MRLIGAMSILVLIGAVPAAAAEVPARKPGLWEVKMSIGTSNAPAQVIRQCVDAATDQMLLSSAGPYDPALCQKRDVQTSANATTIDSTCKVGGKTATAHAIITGSFDSAYTMTVTSQSEDVAGATMIMTIDARRLGPCSADQTPGDIVMGNGAKTNILEMRRRSPSTGVLPPDR